MDVEPFSSSRSTTGTAASVVFCRCSARGGAPLAPRLSDASSVNAEQLGDGVRVQACAEQGDDGLGLLVSPYGQGLLGFRYPGAACFVEAHGSFPGPLTLTQRSDLGVGEL